MIWDPSLTVKAASALLLIVLVIAIRAVLSRHLTRGQDALSDSRRQWLSITNNVSFLVLALGILFIWLPQLQTFALSLTAVAVAVVIATKEYLLCLLGTLYRTASRPFVVGDWIEINGLRGQVAAEGLLTTKLNELGSGMGANGLTGRQLTLPNALLLAHPVRNEGPRRYYQHYNFGVIIDPVLDPAGLRSAALEKLKALVSGQDDEAVAERYYSMVRQRTRAELPGRAPAISLETDAAGKLRYGVRVFCATGKAAALQTELTEYITAEAERMRAASTAAATTS